VYEQIPKKNVNKKKRKIQSWKKSIWLPKMAHKKPIGVHEVQTSVLETAVTGLGPFMGGWGWINLLHTLMSP